MVERRKSPRLRVLKSAQIFIGTTMTIECIVRNLTNAGARNAFPADRNNANALPKMAVANDLCSRHTSSTCPRDAEKHLSMSPLQTNAKLHFGESDQIKNHS